MLPPSFFEHYQDRLNLAVHDINQEYRMGVYHLREAMPQHGDLTMQYGEDGTTEVYRSGDIEVEVPNGSSPDIIATALANPFDYKKKLRAQ
jgi:hypothetical protein